MESSSAGLGNLMRQPQFAYSSEWTTRHAARFYRPVIFIHATLIVVVTMIRYAHEPVVLIGLLFSLAVYGTVFVARMRMGQARERGFYLPYKQFLRGQLSLIGVTLMIGLLAAYGIKEHNLWLLYVLATLIISEHNDTRLGFITLLEVAVLYVSVSYVGWVIYTGDWSSLPAFWQANLQITTNILGIFLITFVFHYLVRNIQGRDTSVNQYRSWLNLAAQQWADVEQPTEQRQTLTKYAEDLTGAKATLWLPKMGSGQLQNLEGQTADQTVQHATRSSQPLLYLGELLHYPSITTIPVTIKFMKPVDMSARILIPIFRLAQKPEVLTQEQELLGILDLTYEETQPEIWRIEQTLLRLNDFVNYARLLLIANRQQEQTHAEKALSIHLNQLVDVAEIANKVVEDVTKEIGFDFATISLVDHNEDLIRCVGSQKAGWQKISIHSMSCDDVQSRTVKEGRLYYNTGEWKTWLDRRIWLKHRHNNLSRVWVPIPRPSSTPGRYPALGTIEAGFRHTSRQHIPSELITALERYAIYVGLAIANAQLHERKQQLTNALTKLQRLGQNIQRSTAFYDLNQMEELVGKSAEELLKADMIMLYRWDERYRRLTLPYKTEHAIRGKTFGLKIAIDCGILKKLNQERISYFSSNARQDPMLVNLKANGKLDKQHRTFTQRQNIKSFAGVPLIGKSKNLLGFLCINYRRRHEFYPEEQQIVEMFAEQAAVALEEIRDQQLARSLAISQERNDLAVELHHQLSQNLFGLEKYVLAATAYAERSRLDKAVITLGKASSISVDSLDALGKILFSLRGYNHPQVDFLQEFSEFVERMSSIYAVKVKFEPEIHASINQQVQFCLFRIAHEALNNALRHAQATNICIAYKVMGDGFASLAIEDNGLGFDVNLARQTERLGLQSMDYYAHKLNSQVVIQSELGRGTFVSVEVAHPAKGVPTWLTNTRHPSILRQK